MVERIVIKDLLAFKSVEIEPHSGLNIFSGPSGAGKSVLLNAILALFGHKDSEANLAELSISGVELPKDLPIEIDENEAVIRQVRREKVRFFVNESQISKSALKSAFDNKVRYLNHKDTSDITSRSLLDLLDLLATANQPQYANFLAQYKISYELFVEQLAELEELKDKESRAVELKELAQFEVEKIERIAPKEGEYEKLMEQKKRLSKKEKIAELVAKTELIRESGELIFELYDHLGVDSTLFAEAMSELNGVTENAISEIEEMANTSPEAILDRIESLAGLLRRYGSIDEALEAVRVKKAEIAGFESIALDIKKLEKLVVEAKARLEEDAKKIASYRLKVAKPLEEKISFFLKQLYLSSAKILLAKGELNSDAGMKAGIELDGVNLAKISSGEFNRLRLALLASRVELGSDEKLVLFLDEIDANVSGEEAASIAKVLKLLATKYQIFAISHQAQLSSKADKHFLVTKKDSVSSAEELDKDSRVNEIARIISGEEITDSALKHAKELLLN